MQGRLTLFTSSELTLMMRTRHHQSVPSRRGGMKVSRASNQSGTGGESLWPFSRSPLLCGAPLHSVSGKLERLPCFVRSTSRLSTSTPARAVRGRPGDACQSERFWFVPFIQASRRRRDGTTANTKSRRGNQNRMKRTERRVSLARNQHHPHSTGAGADRQRCWTLHTATLGTSWP
jgi:hypothetical protein